MPLAEALVQALDERGRDRNRACSRSVPPRASQPSSPSGRPRFVEIPLAAVSATLTADESIRTLREGLPADDARPRRVRVLGPVALAPALVVRRHVLGVGCPPLSHRAHSARQTAATEPRAQIPIRAERIKRVASWALAGSVQLFYLARITGTSVAQIDATYGHLLPDSEEYLRGLLDSYDARQPTAAAQSES